MQDTGAMHDRKDLRDAGPEGVTSEFDDDAGSESAFDPEDLQPRPLTRPTRGRVVAVLCVLLVVALLVFLPPLISVNRYRRQIATSIGASLGRPVRIDSVTLNMLPMPGFTLENFVVGEDPAFGSEPVIRAQTVQATLRVWSLWRRRVEFSRISLNDPSVNLVHRADGRWNIEGILLQASKIEVAPTAQTSASAAPRFPYIEATGARVNVKMGAEKMPLALTEAEFALWLPEPQQWRLRLEGHPARTDTAATDTGSVRVQGTLGKAATMAGVPVDLTAEWRTAPLGGVSWVLLGRDAALRGTMELTANVKGTVGDNAVTTRLQWSDVRRADFVPARPLNVDLSCAAHATAIFHAITDGSCAWLSGETLPDSPGHTPVGLRVKGEVPDVLHPATAHYAVTGAVRVSALLDALRVASSRVSSALTGTGWLTAVLESPATGGNEPVGAVRIPAATLALGGGKALVDGEVGGGLAAGTLMLAPVPLDLGAPQHAVLSAHMDRNGYGMRLTGPVLRSRLMELAAALPQFGDGLEAALPEAVESDETEAPIRVDLASSRVWSGPQTWTAEAAAKPKRGKHRTP